MKRIPIPLESYEHMSPPLSGKRLVNLFAETEPADARTAAALISTPGLVATADAFGAGPVLALNSDQPGVLYAISGTRAWRLTVPFGGTTVIEDLGDVGTAGGDDFAYNIAPTIAVGVNAAVFCVPPRAYTCSHTGPMNQIGGTFPATGARSVTYLDGYFVFTSGDFSSQFFCSLLLDPNDFDALDFAYADGVPNILRRVVTLAGQLWFIGDAAVEIWYNAGSSGLETTPGTSFFPFRRLHGGVIPFGAASMRSVVIADNSVWWVAARGIVFRSKDYQAQRVSTHAIEKIIREEGTANTELALAYTQDGHTFVCWTYGPRTLVYDCATQVWHERSSAADASLAWRPSCVAQVGEQVLFGDSLSGRLLSPVPGLETDDGVYVQRRAVLPPLWAGTSRAFCSRLEIEMETGGITPGGDIILEWSDDGTIWTGSRTMTAGTTGDYRGRVFCTRLGSFRARTFRITAQHRITVYGVDAAISAGSW
jgi:hypothetical protein